MKQIIVDGQVTNYYILENGDCYNSKTNSFLKGQISNSGYRNYNLSITPNYKKRLYAHRLVAQFFLNDGKEISKQLEVNHKDGNKLNNNVTNLELVTHKDNMQHCKNMKLRKLQPVYQFDKNFQLVRKYDSQEEAILQSGLDRNVLGQELRNKKKKLTYNLYYWSYQDTISQNDIITFKNTGKAKPVLQYDLQNNFIKEYPSTAEAGRQCFPEQKRASAHIGECARGRIKHYKNFIWKYKEDIV